MFLRRFLRGSLSRAFSTKKEVASMDKVKQYIPIRKEMNLTHLSQLLKVNLQEIMKSYLEIEGLTYCSRDVLVSQETAEILINEYNCLPVYVEEVIKVPRSPVVTIMGHVDHGKTTLLDSLRNSKICASEFGGITQSIGAFSVQTASGKITFIDTPGHLAFRNMRAKGAEITDIIVLVVCASEGVQPQTLECINHALGCDVPIIVAINKIDLASAEVERVEMELLKAGLVLDKFGGEVLHVPISAKKKMNLDKLEEMILFKAELMELKEVSNVPARGYIIESKVLEGRGPLVSLLVKRGTLKVGDAITAGSTYGVVKELLDENGKQLKQISLSDAAEILGFKGLPSLGDTFMVTSNLDLAKYAAGHKRQEISSYKFSETTESEEKIIIPNMSSIERRKLMSKDPSVLVQRLQSDIEKLESGETTMEECRSIRQLSKRLDKSVQEQIDQISLMFSEKSEGMNIKLVLKAKNVGMLEALEKSIKHNKDTNGVKVHVISAKVGNLGQEDIIIADLFKATILCMDVKLDNHFLKQAETLKIPVKSHKIIYHLLEDIENMVKDVAEPSEDIVSGKAEVRSIYEITVNKSKNYVEKTKVAGLLVTDGTLYKKMLFKVIRKGEEIASGLRVSSLKILKENAKEVKKGVECGIIIDDFDELSEKDVLVSYEVRELPKRFKNERKEVSANEVKDK